MSKDQTTTTSQTTQPWQEAIPELKNILGQSGQLFGRTNATLSNRDVSPFVNQGMGAINTLMGGTGPLSALSDTAGGNYLDVTHSPQWGSMVGGIQDAVNSQFSMAGRTGSPAHAGVMTQELGNLAGRLYDSERGRQLGAASSLGGFLQSGMGALPGMYDFGNADIENLWKNLSRHAAIGQGIGGMGGTSNGTQTTPGPSPLGSILGLGASLIGMGGLGDLFGGSGGDITSDNWAGMIGGRA